MPRTAELTIRCVGDIMGHLSQLIANYDSASGTYDFASDYEYVRDYILEADLALCNVETTFLGDGDYKGYPYFNSPDQLARDIAGAGFDVALFSNNHILDTKLPGLERSLQVLNEAGLKTAGAYAPGADPVLIVPVGDLNIGIVAYTYETGLSGGHRTLNGSIMPAGATERINSFRYYALEEDLERISGDIDAVRLQGADIVIAYFHWGNEYQRKAGSIEKDIALKAAQAGADIIFASHPHVVQEIDEIRIEEDIPPKPPAEELPEPEQSWVLRFRQLFGIGLPEPEEEIIEEPAPKTRTRVVPVYYSMGNFISNQRQETLDNHYTEQGMIASVRLTYNLDEAYIQEIDTAFIPTWVEKYNASGKTRYAIIPLLGDFPENPELQASGHAGRAEGALADMIELIGGEYLYPYEYGAE
jgi:poly-gamma-glutamate synthesis protein (capsule biosynthesis protein)